MTKILAIDTSTDACSAALLSENKNMHLFVIAAQQHTKLILSMIYDLLTEAQLDLNQLDAIAFGCGPGSFTGVRLAASITQGLAFGANIPVIKISSLRALAQEVFVELGKQKVLVAQDARMQEIYWGEYQIDSTDIMQPIIPDQLLAPKQVKATPDKGFTGVGNGWKNYNDFLIKHCNIPLIESKIYPQAQYIAQLAVADFTKGLMVSVQEAQPTYLREEIAWI